MEHRHAIRVRYAESDQMGFAHHSAYVVWCEEARIEWLRAHGRSYRELEEQGVLMPVVELALRYRRPSRFDDRLDLVTSAEPLGPSRLRFTTVVRCGDEARAEAQVTVAATDRNGRPVRLPAGLITPAE
jgi:acyl-CoA thioester hydrolase